MFRKTLPYLLLIPAFLIVGLFVYWPAASSFKLSFQRVLPLGNRVINVGWKNFKGIFTDTSYLNSLLNTLVFVAVTVTITVFVSFLIAQLLNQNLRGMRIFRTCIFSPYAISPAISGALWAFLLSPMVGVVNYFISKVFGVNISWLTARPYAMISVMLATIWQVMPFNLLFYLAALQGIPETLIEASNLDGAGFWKRTFKIVGPMLSPTTFYLVIMDITSSMFLSFAIIDVMTGGGPMESTTTMIYKLYKDAFYLQKTGPAAAQSIILFFVMGLVTLLYFQLVEKRVHYQ